MPERYFKIPIARGEKPSVKFKVLQDTKERGGLGAPDLTVADALCAFIWLKEWLLQNKRLLV